MSGYLEDYGAGEEKRQRREKLFKRLALAVALAAVAGGLAWYLLRNYKEDRAVSAFVELLKKKEYPAAYAMWGCSVEKPCRDYAYARFLEDWGDQGAHADASGVRIEKTRTCTGGVIRTLAYPKDRVGIFVSREDLQITFPPWGDACEVRLKVPAIN